MDYERTVLKKRSRWGLYVVVEQRGTSMTKLMVRSECMLRMVRRRPLRVQFCARWFSTKKNTAEAPRINPVGIQYLGESLQDRYLVVAVVKMRWSKATNLWSYRKSR